MNKKGNPKIQYRILRGWMDDMGWDETFCIIIFI